MPDTQKQPASVSDETPPCRGEKPVRLSLRKRLFFVALLIIMPIVLSLPLIEIGVRWLNPQPLSPPLYQETEFGFWLIPNLDQRPAQSDARVTYRVTTDANGFRGERPVETKEPRDTTRVLIMGDSFTFGVGVEDDETFPAQTEAILNDGANEALRFQVVNAGCPGWGTENALAFWEQRGRSMDADLAVVAFFHNDLGDNMRHLLYQVREGRAVFEPKRETNRLKQIARAVPFYEFLCSHSHLVNLIRRALSQRPAVGRMIPASAQKSAPPGAANNCPAEVPASTRTFDAIRFPSAPWLAGHFAVYEVLMETLLDSIRTHGTPVLLVVLPGTSDIIPGGSPDVNEAVRIGRRWEAEGRAAFLDLTPDLAAMAENGGDPFLPVDHHFSVAGNALVGHLIAEKIREVLTTSDESAPKVLGIEP